MNIKPTRKVTAATAGAAFGTVLTGVAVWLGAPQPPVGLEGAIGTVFAFAFGWLASEDAA